MKLLRSYLSTECHEIFVNKCGDQVTFVGEDKIKDAYKFLGRHAVTPYHVEETVDDHAMQLSQTFSAETDKGNIHLTFITYRGGKYE